jgi:hypothetical protein
MDTSKPEAGDEEESFTLPDDTVGAKPCDDVDSIQMKVAVDVLDSTGCFKSDVSSRGLDECESCDVTTVISSDSSTADVSIESNTPTIPNLNAVAARKRADSFKHWQDHSHAVGLCPTSWDDSPCHGKGLNENKSEAVRFFSFLTSPTRVSSTFCKKFGRVGNMVILKERNTWIQVSTVETTSDENNNYSIEADATDTLCATLGARIGSSSSVNNDSTQRSCTSRSMSNSQRRFDLVLGPYWIVFVTCTLPFVLSLSVCTLKLAINILLQNDSHASAMGVIIPIWYTCTVISIISLFTTAIIDPGILSRYRERPDPSWRWNESAQSFIPPNAVFEPDLNLVVEGYHHTCIYTGTAIGRKNLAPFFLFIGFGSFCFVMDIILLVLAFKK